MDRIEVIGAALVGLYLGWVVITALRSAVMTTHPR